MDLRTRTRGLLVIACTATMWLPLALPEAHAVADQRLRRQLQDAARIHHLSVRDDGALGRDCLRMRGGSERTSISSLIDIMKRQGRPADGAHALGPGDEEGKDERMQMLIDMIGKIDAQAGLEGGALSGRDPPLKILGDLMGGPRGPGGGGVLAQMGGAPVGEQEKQQVEGEDEGGANGNNRDSWNALWEEANRQGLEIPRNPQDVPPLNKAEAKKIFKGGGDEGLDDPMLRLVVDMVPGLNYLGNRKTLYPGEKVLVSPSYREPYPGLVADLPLLLKIEGTDDPKAKEYKYMPSHCCFESREPRPSVLTEEEYMSRFHPDVNQEALVSFRNARLDPDNMIAVLAAGEKEGDIEIQEVPRAWVSMMPQQGRTQLGEEAFRNYSMALWRAAEEGNCEEIVHFVTGKGVDVNSRDPERRWGTALHFAAIYGREDAVETLLNLGADPSLLDNTRSTALHFAAESGARSTCGILLSAGSDADAQDDDGMTALHRAASMSQATSIGDIHGTCKLLLKHGARIGARDDREYTPLHAASEHNNAQVVRELLVAGADPSAIDGLNETALDKAQEKAVADVFDECCDMRPNGFSFEARWVDGYFGGPKVLKYIRKEDNLQEKLGAKFDELERSVESCQQTWEWASRDELAYEYRKKHGVSTQQDRQDGR